MRSRRLPRLRALELSSFRFQDGQASSESIWRASFARRSGEWLKKATRPRFAAIWPGSLRKLKGLGLGALLLALPGVGCATKSAPPPAGEEASTARATPPSQPQAKRPFLVAAFSWLPKLSFRRPKPPQAQVPRLIGVIKMVDEDDRFVLIDATTFQGAGVRRSPHLHPGSKRDRQPPHEQSEKSSLSHCRYCQRKARARGPRR